MKKRNYAQRMICYILAAFCVLGVTVLKQDSIARYINNAQTAYLIAARQTVLIADQRRVITVKAILGRFQKTNPPFSRVRVALIHNGRGPGGPNPVQWDAIAGFSTDNSLLPLLNNRPLSDWDGYISDLLDNQCTIISRETMQDPEVKARMAMAKTFAVLSCPIINAKGELLGAVFGGWDDAAAPIPTDLEPLKIALDNVADEIAASIRPPD